MTIEDRCKKLNYLITCMKCEVSGKECNEKCSTQYLAGNMGEIIQNLEAISKEISKKGLEKYIDACKTLQSFCWQFRPYCENCPFFEPGMCTMGIPANYNIETIKKILEKYDKRKEDK